MQENALHALGKLLSQKNAVDQPMARTLFTGWLTKDAQNSRFLSQPRQRFFVLTRDSLEWFKSEEDIKRAPHGRLLLEGLRVERGGTKVALMQPGLMLGVRYAVVSRPCALM